MKRITINFPTQTIFGGTKYPKGNHRFNEVDKVELLKCKGASLVEPKAEPKAEPKVKRN